MLSAILSGWFLVNVMAPLMLPVMGLLILKLLPLPGPPANLKVMTTVKDGQLCWAVVAMGASTIYELWTAFEAYKPLPVWRDFAMASTILLMLPAMLLASGGSVFSTPLLTRSSDEETDRIGSVKRWVRHYKVFVASVVLTFVSAFILTSAHFAIAE